VSVYLDGSTVEQCRDLLARGEQLEVLAGRLRISSDDLRQLLGLQDQPRGRAAAAGGGEVDLWAGERLEGVL
jgi:hypothetical protein